MQDSPPTAGDRLLGFFDRDPVIASEKLLRCRQKLVRRFAAERCHDTEDLANETLRRVLDALDKNPQRLTTRIEAFISGFATNLIYESRRAPIHKEDPLEEIGPANEPRTRPLEDLLTAFSEQQDLRNCLERCLEQLDLLERNTLINYYSTEPGEKAKAVRRNMALSLGLTSGQLRRLAFNLRSRVEAFTRQCLEGRG
jgi:hypothetical protein